MKTWEDVREVVEKLRKEQLKPVKRYCSECGRQTDHVQREGPIENMTGWRCVICGWVRGD